MISPQYLVAAKLKVILSLYHLPFNY